MSLFHLKNRQTRVYGGLGQEKKSYRPNFPKFSGGWLKKLAIFGAVGLALAFIVGTGVVIWVSRDLPDPNKLNDRQVAQSTKIYDRTGGHLLYEIYQNQKRTLVNLDQISSWAPKATIAVEDKHFYEHSGVRILSIIRAGFNNLIGRKAGSGGASTLTQQFIKKTMVGDERTLFRKIKEAILAIRLEKKYSKDDILKMYLNEIPYGSTNYGIEAASQSYFHKSAKDLDLPESATLAAMIQAPSRYLNDLDSLRSRRDLVLRLMFEQGMVTEQQKNEAQNSALRIYRTSGITDAPHFVLYVKQLLADQFGEKAMDTDGLRVITTLDYDKQKLAETVVKEEGDKLAKAANANNAALVALDPRTAQILAMVGSRDFYNEEIDGQFNVAVLGKRQPGSSFKPFVYTAAFEKGYTPDTVLYDVSTNFDRRVGGDYTPKNYDGKEHGLVTLRKALQGSLNIPAVKTLYLVGLNNVLDFAKRFGYTTLNENAGLSLVLGGSEVNLLEHTNGYATLADNGVYHPPVSILKVTNAQGETLYEWKDAPGDEAVKPELAATITSVLTDNNARAYIFGLNSTLVLPGGRPVAAKTGTTNDNKDAWTLGYTPSLATGVWVGNTIPSPMKGGGSTLAGVIWNRFMKESVSSTPAEQFPAPPPNDAEKPVLRGSDGGIKIMINRVTGKLASSSTPEWLKTERTYLPPHDILFYVNKDDPRGPALSNPSDDPQYDNWEAALQDWVSREQAAGHEISFSEPPSEYDTPQSMELLPKVDILAPADNSVLASRQINIQVNASAPRGVSQVTYFIDESRIGVVREFPFNLNYYAQTLQPGTHTLKVRAEDDLGNGAEQSAIFDLQVEMDAPNVNWFDGSPLALKEDDFPRSFNLVPFRWTDTKEIKVYLQAAGGSKKWIYTFNQTDDKLFNGMLMFTWKHSPGAGDYSLVADLTDNKGGAKEKILEVNIK